MYNTVILKVAEESKHVASYKREQCANQREEFFFCHDATTIFDK